MNIATAYVELRVKSDVAKREAQAEARAVAGQMTKTFAQVFSAAVVVRELGKATQAAAGLEQAVGGTSAVFGEASKTIDRFAKTSAESAGLSQRAFRELTSQIGALLQGFGFAQDESAEWSAKLAQLGADLSATFGGRPEEAVQALGAALRGEFDPLERFGVSLSAAKVNAKAVELGLAATTSAVDANAKAQAGLAIIMEQSAKAQGQFAREADTAAGKQAILSAKFEDARAKLGQQLIPVFATAVDLLTRMVDIFSELPGPVQVALVALAGIAAVAGPIKRTVDALGGLTQMVGRLRTTSPQAGAALAVVGVAIVGLGLHAKKSAEDARQLAEAIDEVGRASDEQLLRAYFDVLKEGLENGGDTVNKFARANLEAAIRVRDFLVETNQYPAAAATLTAAIDKEIEARKQSNETNAEGTTQIDALTGATDSLAGATSEATAETWRGEDAQKALSTAISVVEQAIIDANDAHRELIATMIEGVSSTFDLEQASQEMKNSYLDLQDQIAETNETLADSEATDRDKERALRDLRIAEIDLAEKALATAQTYAEQQGATKGSADEARLMIDALKLQQQEYPELRDEIQAYIDRLQEIPADVKTRVGALIDEVGFDRAMQRIRDLAVAAGNTFTPRVTAPRVGGPTFSAAGRYTDRRTLSWLSEGNLPEVTLPLTKPSRIVELMSDRRVAEPIAAAMGSASPSGPTSLTLIIEGRPFTAMIADHDRQLAGALAAGKRN